MSNDDRPMTPEESLAFTKETFFTSTDEVVAKKAARLAKRLEKRKQDRQFKILEDFCKVLEPMPKPHRDAMIRWLAARFDIKEFWS